MTKINLLRVNFLFLVTASLMICCLIGCGNEPSNPNAKAPVLKNSVGMEFKPLSGGTFTMDREDGIDAHQVTLSKPFEMGVHEVTQEQYELVMGKNPSEFKGPQNPVETVSWDDAVEFCRKLSAVPDEKAAGRVYRLPTSAEWEYACRAGTTTKYCFGDDDSGLGDYAWYKKNSGNKSHAAGQKKPNQWGLYDMHGNVLEWCQDEKGSYRMYRGGYWNKLSSRSSDGGWTEPTRCLNSLGFRVARGRSINRMKSEGR